MSLLYAGQGCHKHWVPSALWVCLGPCALPIWLVQKWSKPLHCRQTALGLLWISWLNPSVDMLADAPATRAIGAAVEYVMM